MSTVLCNEPPAITTPKNFSRVVESSIKRLDSITGGQVGPGFNHSDDEFDGEPDDASRNADDEEDGERQDTENV